MALPYRPHRGEILICDFDAQACGAEMVKRRPVVVISRKETHGRGLCTVVPFSTTAPRPAEKWHHPLPHLTVAGWKSEAPMWAKCDMLATVSFRRLNQPYLRTRSSRKYLPHRLCGADLLAVIEGVKSFLLL